MKSLLKSHVTIRPQNEYAFVVDMDASDLTADYISARTTSIPS